MKAHQNHAALGLSWGLNVILALTLAGAAFGQGAKISQLHITGATSLYASAVNASNHVAGTYTTLVLSNTVTKGFAYLGGSNYRTFVAPRSNNFTRANGITDSGEIAGDFLGTDNYFHGFTVVGSTFTQFDLPGGRNHFSTSIFGINNGGSIVGAAGGGTLGVNNEGWVKIGNTVTTFYGTGTDNTFVLAINNSNTFVGQYFDAGGVSYGFSGVISGGNAVLTPVAFPGAVQTGCTGINDSGVITGYYYDASGFVHGFMDNGGVFTTSNLPGVAGINNAGSYVGYYIGPGNIEYGYLATPQAFAPASIMVPHATSTSTYGVNNAGTLVGQYTRGTATHGMLLMGNALTNIDDPSGVTGTTTCEGVNASNTIVGWYEDASNQQHSFVYSNGTFTNDLVSGAMQSVAYNINDAGDIAGQFLGSDSIWHGFLLEGGAGGTLIQLDVPGSGYTVAWGVNNSRIVTVSAVDSSGDSEAYTYNASTMTYTNINLPGALGMTAHSINDAGAVVYSWIGPDLADHGGLFMGGAFYLLDVPNGSSTRADGLNNSGLIVGRYLLPDNINFAGFKGMK